jgi:MCM AAA-lid domain
MSLLREYIAHARAHCKPELTDAAAAELMEGYITMRKQGISRKVHTAAPCASSSSPGDACLINLSASVSCGPQRHLL